MNNELIEQVILKEQLRIKALKQARLNETDPEIIEMINKRIKKLSKIYGK